MIPVKCPHCRIGLKVDEKKIPQGITTFKCPKCKNSIPLSLLDANKGESDTLLIHPLKKSAGKLWVAPNTETEEQSYPLYEGMNIIGRKSNSPTGATIGIVTTDKSMSREHIRIEIKKDAKGGYIHYLSDNNSKNHTLYNSNQLENGEVIVLQPGDEIIIGRTVLYFKE